MTMPKREQAPPESVAHDHLRSFVERIERMHEERRAIGDDIKEIYAEAKGIGFDTKALKIVIRKREQDPEKRAHLEALVDIYEAALGTPIATRAPAHDEPPLSSEAQVRQDRSEWPDYQPVQVADQSTAALKEVPEVTRSGKLRTVISEDSALAAPELTDERMPGSQDPKPESGNQAPPVDTLSEFGVRNNVAQPPRTNTPVPDAGAKVATHSDPASAGAAAATDEATPSPQPPASSVVATSNVTQLRPEKRITFNDKPHVDCLDPGQCGGFSNLGLCPRCKAVAGGGAAEIEHHGSVA